MSDLDKFFNAIRDTLTEKQCRQKALQFAYIAFKDGVDSLALAEIMKDLEQFSDFSEILDRALFTAIDYGLASWNKNDAVRLAFDAMEDNLLTACKTINC